jgi:hypothetical protein
MSFFFNKAEFIAQLFARLDERAPPPDSTQGASPAGEAPVDGMRLLQMLAGVAVETALVFDEPAEGLHRAGLELERMLGCAPSAAPLGPEALPPPYIIDYHTEQGRLIARSMFEEWLQCPYEFHELVLFAIHGLLAELDLHGQRREETLRLFLECVARCYAYEVAAQELCEIVIERKIGREGWKMSESIAGLSAVAGRCLALSQNACERFSGPSLPDKLDQIAYVMTQEAVRLGIPAGTDWRFGLAANDYPASAPYDLINGLEPSCQRFFRAIDLPDLMDQAVACAKAAGRMLAVAAGGEAPEIEPVIAKPLAMAAITETYRTICQAGGASAVYQ